MKKCSRWMDCTIAISGTVSAEVDLGDLYDELVILVPTIDSAQLTIQGAENSGGTFYDIYTTDPADGGNNKLISASGTHLLCWIIPIAGFEFIKITASAAQTTAAVTMRIRGVSH